ncbi:hypothetical protein NP095_09700 [Aeromicrobium duanguangcaii]|uniref:DUF3558 domain-containing protein n=1 Tax=Aeromicrobium duanguangcaii TaxID=2968086 RepID=A0ABY5KDH3_9ACTN|nr:hypothetical protein [Aeromicrobium duanguangcaii]UUI67481.1 hypothetical protein NP095_09700 [Aeromicrobium duanguangcaii]
MLASTACSGSDDREASGPTPDEALAELELAAGELLGAGAPGNEITVLPRREVLCGGPGGNERIKVKYSYVAGAGLVDDPEQTLGAATAAGEALGLETELREPAS